jgi:hypothetical protein
VSDQSPAPRREHRARRKVGPERFEHDRQSAPGECGCRKRIASPGQTHRSAAQVLRRAQIEQTARELADRRLCVDRAHAKHRRDLVTDRTVVRSERRAALESLGAL